MKGCDKRVSRTGSLENAACIEQMLEETDRLDQTNQPEDNRPLASPEQSQ
jgi:hypothetical protein